MKKLESYINGNWFSGTGEGVPMHDAVTGEIIALSDTDVFDFDEIINYGRVKGDALCKMTFQDLSNMLKKLAFY